MAYNYHESVKSDIKEYIEENFDTITEEMRNDVFNEVLNDDGVTGSASGSYTMNRATAKQYVINNIDLLKEAADEHCYDDEEIGALFLRECWEDFDVIIRLHLVDKYFNDIFSEYLD